MMKKTDYSIEKKYAVGITLGCIIYAFVRSLFARDTNDGVVQPFSVEKSNIPFYIVGCIIVAILLIALIFIGRKRGRAVPVGLIPFLLVSALGEVRLTGTGPASDGKPLFAVCFAVFLLAVIVIYLTEIYWIAPVAIMAVGFINPQSVPLLFVPLSMAAVPYIYGKKGSAQMSAFMCVVLSLFAGILLSVIRLTRAGVTPKVPEISQLIVPLIFVLVWCGLCGYVIYKSTDRKSRILLGVLCAVPVCVLVGGLSVGSAVSMVNTGVTTVAATFCTLLVFCKDENGIVRTSVEKATENKILYFLLLMFTARATAFVYVFFGATLYR